MFVAPLQRSSVGRLSQRGGSYGGAETAYAGLDLGEGSGVMDKLEQVKSMCRTLGLKAKIHTHPNGKVVLFEIGGLWGCREIGEDSLDRALDYLRGLGAGLWMAVSRVTERTVLTQDQALSAIWYEINNGSEDDTQRR